MPNPPIKTKNNHSGTLILGNNFSDQMQLSGLSVSNALLKLSIKEMKSSKNKRRDLKSEKANLLSILHQKEKI